MGASGSYYLRCRHDDFAELTGQQLESGYIPFAAPANDNTPTRVRLLARCQMLLLHLIASGRRDYRNCACNPCGGLGSNT